MLLRVDYGSAPSPSVRPAAVYWLSLTCPVYLFNAGGSYKAIGGKSSLGLSDIGINV
jgi:hypothetical protein